MPTQNNNPATIKFWETEQRRPLEKIDTVFTSIFSKLFIKSVKFKIFTNAVISQPFFLMVFFVLFPKT
jgi:hypothetical protein